MPSVPSWLSDLARATVDALGKALRSRGQQPDSSAPDSPAPRQKSRPQTRTQPKRQRERQRERPPSTPQRDRPGGAPDPSGQRSGREHDEEPSPGQYGANATIEVDPQRVGPVRMEYHPNHDGDPDPGEIVWTWVPFEEADGRGKDRPVLVVAVESGQQAHRGSVLAVQLTSKDHDGDRDFVPIGAGSWDGEHRPSWVNIDRVVRVHASGMRREAAALGRDPFTRVEAALRSRYNWK